MCGDVCACRFGNWEKVNVGERRLGFRGGGDNWGDIGRRTVAGCWIGRVGSACEIGRIKIVNCCFVVVDDKSVLMVWVSDSVASLKKCSFF